MVNWNSNYSNSGIGRALFVCVESLTALVELLSLQIIAFYHNTIFVFSMLTSVDLV